MKDIFPFYRITNALRVEIFAKLVLVHSINELPLLKLKFPQHNRNGTLVACVNTNKNTVLLWGA